MEFKSLAMVLLVAAAVSAQNFRVCIHSSNTRLCNTLDLGGSQIVCAPVETNVDCAIRMNRNEVTFGVFSEEEVLLLSQRSNADYRVVATIRDVQKTDPFAFEAVSIVPATFTSGLEGLRGANYCHPGLDQQDQRWSPRVLRALEQAAAGSDRCPQADQNRRTAEELELETINRFFGAGCRPGQWSANATVDANLKRQYPNLCSLCGPNSSCNNYDINMGVNVAGVDNNNRHIQALECMRTNSGGNNQSVAYVAWQHAREYFANRYPEIAGSYAVLCPDGSTQTLTVDILASTTAPCAFVRQPWRAIVANPQEAESLITNLRTWWSNGNNPGGSTWQATLFNGIIGGSEARVFFEDALPTVVNYTSGIRPIPPIDATSTCIPARRWCVTSPEELEKCTWVRMAAHTLGIQPPISCLMRSNVVSCLQDIKDGQIDFIATQANYGFLARQHYSLSPVKLVQNTRSNVNSTTRVAAFIKASATDITRFENLRGKRACFPEFGGLAYVAFIRAAQQRGVISRNECDYSRAVGEFFNSACAPGAIDATHTIGQSSYNATNLCTVCRPQPWHTVPTNSSQVFCAWDYRNAFFGNNGSLNCLSDPNNDVAFLQIRNINSYITPSQASQYRALCYNNSLALTAGVNVDDNCLLAHVVDTEVVARRNDPLNNALSVLLETLEQYFGYLAQNGGQLINLEIFSPFDGVNDLLFKDSVIGLSEPSSTSENEFARNYFELFEHLESCTSAADPGVSPGFAHRHLYSFITLIITTLITRFVIY